VTEDEEAVAGARRDGGPPGPHERIEEILAAHALRALDEADMLEAERVLSEHVPECDRCKQTLSELVETASELALAAPAAAPPDLLLPRLHREIRRERIAARRTAWSWVGTAAAVAVLGLSVWNAVLNSRLSHESDAKHRFAGALGTISRPGFRTVSFDVGRHVGPTMKAAFRPGDAHVLLIGSHVPQPAEGDVYRLWLGSDGQFTAVRDFVPEEGIVVLPFLIDLSRYDQILVTEESEDGAIGQPSGTRRWLATLHVG
jgi:hypothetical protein